MDERTARASIPWRAAAAVLVVAALAAVYVAGGVRHLRDVNTDDGRTDQSAYLSYAAKMADSDYAHVGGRNRMPVFPFLASLVHEPGLSKSEFFVRVKYLNLALSLVMLVGVWLVARALLPALETCALTLTAAFNLYVYRAPYAQAELLYYTISFAAFAAMLRLLRRPGWRLAIAAGAAAGLAQLTKFALLPMLLAFGAWSLAAAAGDFAGARRRAAVRLAAAAVVGLVFLAVMYPYLRTSRERFGRWFYNVNTTFYAWTDSWKEARSLTRAHGDRRHWPDLPPEEIPRPTRYWREHTVGEIAARVGTGYAKMFHNLRTRPFGYGPALLLYALGMLAVVLRWPHRAARELCADGRWVVSGFAASVVLGSSLLVAFFAPISPGPRLMLALYLPSLLCLSAVLARPAWRDDALLSLGRLALRPRHVAGLVIAWVAVHVVTQYPRVVATTYAGY